ncbi:putative AraC family transcriptional regulator [Paenibacillus sp. 598K]|uniref:helix-turn-helix domain-containing protein n=1 Tax=Paenibacillus sp. 598K TaxID=1117987 RepID=UPI000FF9886B|nr:helix-turn-helix domain-containing protein [Paenibacillus sp. 598K]GBF75101.1 putative AraC family transcriptional regulator [Paenibacillus sp. 598K]
MTKWLALLSVNKLFFKILLYFLSLLMLVIIIGVFSYTNYVNEFKRDYQDKLTMNLQSSADAIDGYLQMIHESGVGFFGDPVVKRLLKPRDAYTEADLGELQLLPQSVGRTSYSLNRFIDEVFVYADDRSVFTGSGLNNFDSFFGKFYRYLDYDADYWREQLDSRSSIDILYPTTVHNSFGTKRVISFIATNRDSAYPAVMVATIRERMLLRTMEVILDSGVNQVVVVDAQGERVLSSDPDFAADEALRVIRGESGGVAELPARADGELPDRRDAKVRLASAEQELHRASESMMSGDPALQLAQEVSVYSDAGTGLRQTGLAAVGVETDAQIATAARADVSAEQESRLESDSGIPADPATELRVGAVSYTVASVTSGLYGWTYYAFTPVDEYRRQASGMLDLIVGICVLLCVIGGLFSFVFSFRIYNPIRKLGEVLAHEESGLNWGEQSRAHAGDLQRIGSGIHELISYRLRYQHELHALTQEYLDQSLIQLMHGIERRAEQDEELVRTMRQRLAFDQSGYVCLVVSVEFLPPFYQDIQDVDRIVIQSKLKKIIDGLLRDFMTIYVLESGKNNFLCVVNTAADGARSSIEQGLERLVQTFIHDWAYCRIHIGVGKHHEELQGITRSYREALTALHTIEDGPPFMVRYADDPGSAGGAGGTGGAHYSFADENRLLNLLKIGDKDGLTGLTEELLERSEKRSAPYRVRALLLGEMYETALRYSRERGMDPEELLAGEEHARIASACERPEDLGQSRALLLRLLHAIADEEAGSQRPPGRSAELAQTIRQYVEAHYTSDLYLESIAEQMGVSMKYASRVFKGKYDMNLTDYISWLRIERAKELLAGEQTIAEVSEQCGFYNRTTFLRTFKRLEGVSPNDYRKLIRKDEGRDQGTPS